MTQQCAVLEDWHAVLKATTCMPTVNSNFQSHRPFLFGMQVKALEREMYIRIKEQGLEHVDPKVGLRLCLLPVHK